MRTKTVWESATIIETLTLLSTTHVLELSHHLTNEDDGWTINDFATAICEDRKLPGCPFQPLRFFRLCLTWLFNTDWFHSIGVVPLLSFLQCPLSVVCCRPYPRNGYVTEHLGKVHSFWKKTHHLLLGVPRPLFPHLWHGTDGPC